jgi:hypothetical protein
MMDIDKDTLDTVLAIIALLFVIGMAGWVVKLFADFVIGLFGGSNNVQIQSGGSGSIQIQSGGGKGNVSISNKNGHVTIKGKPLSVTVNGKKVYD